MGHLYIIFGKISVADPLPISFHHSIYVFAVEFLLIPLAFRYVGILMAAMTIQVVSWSGEGTPVELLHGSPRRGQ